MRLGEGATTSLHSLGIVVLVVVGLIIGLLEDNVLLLLIRNYLLVILICVILELFCPFGLIVTESAIAEGFP